MRVFIRERDGNEEARIKYAYCRVRGTSVSQRDRMRHWRWSKILRYFGEDVKIGLEYRRQVAHLRAIAQVK